MRQTIRGKSGLVHVARQCGVSPSTVSRVLNNYTGFQVSKDVRARIIEVAAKLNYRPNMVARNLSAKRTNLVAVVGLQHWSADLPGVTEHAIAALTRELNRHGYGVCANFMPDSSPHELPHWRVDGVAVAYAEQFRAMQHLQQVEFPFVCVNCEPSVEGACVLVDDAGGTMLAMQHLWDLGHRRIAFVSAPASGAAHYSLPQRMQTYRQFMAERGQPAVEHLIEPWGEHGVNPTMPYPDSFLRQAAQTKITAILAYDHIIAVKLLQAAMQMGISIPGRISLVCFNDEFPCDMVSPPLTAVSLPSAEMGEQAAQLLLSRMAAQQDEVAPADAPRRLVLPERLVVRASTAPPAADPPPHDL